MSLNNVYDISMKHALENIIQKGGQVKDDRVIIRLEKPVPVKFEKSFEGVFPSTALPVKWNAPRDEATFEFEGTGFVIRGDASEWDSKSDYVFHAEIFIDDNQDPSVFLPVNFTTRRYDLAWKYDLPPGKHKVSMKILNPSASHRFRIDNALIYASKPNFGVKTNEMAEKAFQESIKNK